MSRGSDMLFISTMVDKQKEAGFTVAELIVTLVVMSLFMIFFFQAFMTTQAQQAAVAKRAVANDIASSNLQKISSRALIPATTAACDGSASSPNNTYTNPSLDPLTAGSVIATDESGALTPKWNGDGSPNSNLAKEQVTTPLPSTGVIQKLLVIYPRGCDANMPAKIISIVTYGSESITHAAYVK